MILCGVFVAGVLWQIHTTVDENCQIAQEAHPHPDDDMASLVAYVESSSHTLEARSHLGVWTLGRLADARALPALETYYTGQPCDHEVALCQYELEKAIRRCGGTLAEN